MEPYAQTREQYVEFAADAGDSPCFEAWAWGIADDPEVLRWLGLLPPLKQQPNLVFAAARWHGVPARPGDCAYDGLRSALLGDTGAIRDTILARSTQTNEVGRLATLLPAFGLAAQRDPIALVEVGASAGLTLYPDRWSYRWRTERGEVSLSPDSVPYGAPPLTCRVTGRAPLPSQVPTVAWRGGVDLNPLDVADDDAVRWLENLVWPEEDDRRARLRRAVEIARAEPPYLVRGDLLDRLPDLVDEAAAAAPGAQVVVFHSAVIAYLEAADRRRFEAMMADLVGAGRCHWVSNEGKRVLPGVTASGPPVPDDHPTFVLGLDGQALAWTHGHGRSMRWVAAPD